MSPVYVLVLAIRPVLERPLISWCGPRVLVSVSTLSGSRPETNVYESRERVATNL